VLSADTLNWPSYRTLFILSIPECALQSMQQGRGMARFFGAKGHFQQWPPLTEIINLKKKQLFVKFLHTRLSNVKFDESGESVFHIKYLFCQPSCCTFNCAARDDYTPAARCNRGTRKLRQMQFLPFCLPLIPSPIMVRTWSFHAGRSTCSCISGYEHIRFKGIITISCEIHKQYINKYPVWTKC
jgi:hypothetical protein